MTPDPFVLIEEAEAATDSGQRQTLLESAIGLLEDGAERSAKICFALGYAWYLLPEDSQIRHEQVLRNLGEALRQQPENPYARLYLAHHYFDLGQFALALPILQEFRPDFFEGFGQGWRDVKIAEMALCCILEMHETAKVEAAMADFLERTRRLNGKDLPEPRELNATLKRLRQG